MQTKVKRVWPGWEIDTQAPDGGVLGSGSFGDVYRICRSVHGITECAALKVLTIPRDNKEHNQLKQEYDTEEQLSNYYLEVKQSFENEYATMVLLRGHENIVYCDDIRFDPHEDNQGWDIHIKMELLTPMVKRLPSGYSEELTRRLGIDICKALVFCHKMGIIHRDIKPQNIFMFRDERFKLGDFGIAKHMEGTQVGTIAGTEDYMAPEVNFLLPYSSLADIYSLGLVMYWMLNDYVGPFLSAVDGKPGHSKKMEARTKRLSGADLPEPAHGSAALKKIVMKACAFEQKNRFASAEEMLQALLALESSDHFTYDSEDEKTIREHHVTVKTSATEFEDEDETIREIHPKTGAKGTDKSESGEKGNSPENKSKPDTPELYFHNPEKNDLISGTPEKKEESGAYFHTPSKKALLHTAADEGGKSESDSHASSKKESCTNTQLKTTDIKTTAKVVSKAGSNTTDTTKVGKKKPKRWIIGAILLIGLALAAYFVLTSPANYLQESVTKIKGNDSISMVEVGTIEDPAANLQFYDYVTDRFPDENGYFSWYTCAGEKVEGIQFKNITYLGNGLYYGKSGDAGINILSFFTQYGQMLSSQDICMVEWAAGQDENNPRYLLLYTADAKTDDKERCLVSFSEDYSYVSASSQRDIMYTGTVRIFDVFSMKFVPNLPTITNDKDVEICKNTIVIKNDDETHTVYDESGNPVNVIYNDLSVYNGYMINRSFNSGAGGYTNHILDEQGNRTYTTNHTLMSINRIDPYLKLHVSYEEPEKNKIVDIYGNVILEGYDAADFFGGMFLVYNKQRNKYGLITPQGKVVLPPKYEYIYETYMGYCVAKYKGKCTLVNSDGILIGGLSTNPYQLFLQEDESLFVINDRSYDLDVGSSMVTMLTTGVVKAQSEDTGFWRVYDLFTGEALLPSEYERIQYTADHLYAYRDGVWAVYEVHFQRDGAVG